MEELINALLKNPFLVLLLLGGIFSMFKGKGDQRNEEEKKQAPRQQRTDGQQRKRPTSISDTIRKTMETFEQEVQKNEQTKPESKPIQTMSIEEHREKQLQRLTNRIASESSIQDENKNKSQSIQLENNKKTVDQSQLDFNSEFKSNLTREGLMQSVIMAEVLGSPRSRQPYQSVVTNRRRK